MQLRCNREYMCSNRTYSIYFPKPISLHKTYQPHRDSATHDLLLTHQPHPHFRPRASSPPTISSAPIIYTSSLSTCRHSIPFHQSYLRLAIASQAPLFQRLFASRANERAQTASWRKVQGGSRCSGQVYWGHLLGRRGKRRGRGVDVRMSVGMGCWCAGV